MCLFHFVDIKTKQNNKKKPNLNINQYNWIKKQYYNYALERCVLIGRSVDLWENDHNTEMKNRSC